MLPPPPSCVWSPSRRLLGSQSLSPLAARRFAPAGLRRRRLVPTYNPPAGWVGHHVGAVMKSTTAAICRRRRNHNSDRSVIRRGAGAMQAPSLLLIASFAALHAVAGGRGNQSALASKALAVPKIDAEEQQGMHELFDDLDSDDDDRFEQKELGNMLQQFGLDSKHGAKNPWKWKDALRRMDKNEDTFLSKLEVINHMKRLVMSRRQVADWLRYSVGLPQYIQTFERNSVTGYDLPALLEGTRGGDDGPEGTAATDNDILKSELGVESALHRKQIKRAILNRMFGEAPHKPTDFSCSPGRTAGSVQVEWEESESDLDGEDMVYRLRRQDPLTKSWVTLVDKGALLGHVDEGLPSASVVSYKLDVWSMNGGSEEMRLNGCQASGGTLTWIVGCVLDVVQRSLGEILAGWLSCPRGPVRLMMCTGDC